MADEKPEALKDKLERKKGEMKLERSSFEAHWKELADFIRPRRGRFFVTDRNRGEKRYNKIINSCATQAHQVARSGMLAGIMSPARPWFSLESTDPDLMEAPAVKEFLYNVEKLLSRIFSDSNLYDMASTAIGEVLQFGTACMTHEDDYEDVARFYTHTAGAYAIAQNDRYDVDTLMREFEWTVYQTVKKFGLENCSTTVQRLYDRSSYNEWVPITHFICPNEYHKEDNKFSKPFNSYYYEPAGKPDDWLSKSGYFEFPAYCLRWELTDGDIYGTDCPGMTSLGDIKQLQAQEKLKAQGIHKMVNPPMKGPASLKNVPLSSLPGGLNLYDGDATREGLAPIYMVNPQLGELRIDMEAVEQRIKDGFYTNLFRAISDMEGVQPKNEFELMKRDQERLLQLGPVLQRFENDFLDKLIDRTFNQCVRAGLIGGDRGIPVPEELSGAALKVNYISSLSMAQRSVATGGIDRLVAFAGNLAALGWTNALDKIDPDQAIDEYANVTGVPPRVVVPDDVVAGVRDERAQKQEMAETAALAESASNSVKTVTEAFPQNAK